MGRPTGRGPGSRRDGREQSREPDGSRPSETTQRKSEKPAAERTTGGASAGERDEGEHADEHEARRGPRRGIGAGAAARAGRPTKSATWEPEIARMWAAPASRNRRRSASRAPRGRRGRSERRSPASLGGEGVVEVARERRPGRRDRSPTARRSAARARRRAAVGDLEARVDPAPPHASLRVVDAGIRRGRQERRLARDHAPRPRGGPRPRGRGVPGRRSRHVDPQRGPRRGRDPAPVLKATASSRNAVPSGPGGSEATTVPSTRSRVSPSPRPLREDIGRRRSRRRGPRRRAPGPPPGRRGGAARPRLAGGRSSTPRRHVARERDGRGPASAARKPASRPAAAWRRRGRGLTPYPRAGPFVGHAALRYRPCPCRQTTRGRSDAT